MLTLLLLVALILAFVKIIPAYVAYYQFEDAIKSEARFALTGYPKKSLDDIRDDIYKKAQELDIPASRDAIQLIVDPTNGQVDITVDYNVTFDLALFAWPHDFHAHADNHTI